jgi:uncharacterized heparinase superfamily protein
MVSEMINDRARAAAAAATQVSRTALKSMLRSSVGRWLKGMPSAYNLLIIPQDLRTADPSFATELYDGYFGLAGAVGLVGSESPFAIRPPTHLWRRELYAFSWLKHLHAAQDGIAREKARALISEWFAHSRKAPPAAWDVGVAARRLIAMLSHAGFVLDGVNAQFYDAMMGGLTRELHQLSVSYSEAGRTLARLQGLTALIFAGLCIAEQQSYLTACLGAFSAELDRQILPDGGHISRNPNTLIELMLDLLPLRQCFTARAQETPEALTAAINRMAPMLRFMRHGDGSLARFNGMGPTQADLAATVLAYDDASHEIKQLAPDSGYARLERGGVVVIVDVGSTPPLSCSAEAHAGRLSFEMCSGTEPVIVNCGAARDEESDWWMVARSTAAHSTLTINDQSSARLIRRLGGHPPREVYLLAGPKSTPAEIQEEADGVSLRAAHESYRDRFGVIHRRWLHLAEDGSCLQGVDELASPPGGRVVGREHGVFAIRFHLHPRVMLSRSQDGNSVILQLPNEEIWQLTANADLVIEESIFLADPIYQRRCLQVALRGEALPESRITWTIKRMPNVQRLRPRETALRLTNHWTEDE